MTSICDIFMALLGFYSTLFGARFSYFVGVIFKTFGKVRHVSRQSVQLLLCFITSGLRVAHCAVIPG